MCPKSNKKKIPEIEVGDLLKTMLGVSMMPMVFDAIGRAKKEKDALEVRTRVENRAFSKGKVRRRFASFSYSETKLTR